MSSLESECPECLMGSDGEHDEGCSHISACGLTYDHPAREGDPTCPECDADLSEWWADDGE
jgi:hypothetical protein